MVGSYFFDQKRTFRTFPEKCTFPPPSDPCAPGLMFSNGKSMFWGEESELFRKNELFPLFPLWAPKSHANPSTKQRAGEVII